MSRSLHPSRPAAAGVRLLPAPLLRWTLLADAGACAVAGLALTFLAGSLPFLGIPDGVLRGAGLVLLLCALLTGYLGTRVQLAPAAVWLVIGINALWALDSVLALIAGWLAPTTLGTVLVLVQAAAVLTIAELQWVGLRRSTPA